jgi:hypothetical protein
MKKIVLGKDGLRNAQLDVDALLRTRMLVQANSGKGKSWLLRRIAEQLFGSVPVIIIDPEAMIGERMAAGVEKSFAARQRQKVSRKRRSAARSTGNKTRNCYGRSEMPDDGMPKPAPQPAPDGELREAIKKTADLIWGDCCMAAIQFENLANEDDSSIEAALIGTDAHRIITNRLETLLEARIAQERLAFAEIVATQHIPIAEYDLGREVATIACSCGYDAEGFDWESHIRALASAPASPSRSVEGK